MNYININDYKNSGYIYIATYDWHPNTLKIGLTKGCPIKRIKVMNDSTYTIGTFHLVDSYRTANVHDVERIIHKSLDDKRLCKEFFNVSIDDARKIILDSIMTEDFSESKSLVKNCIHLIDYRDGVNIPRDGQMAIVEYNKVKFYVLSTDRMAALLHAEQTLERIQAEHDNQYLDMPF